MMQMGPCNSAYEVYVSLFTKDIAGFFFG